MGAVIRFRDRLVNLMTGGGTARDPGAYGFYAFTPLTHQQVEASYRSSWLMRNAVDIPAYDMTRAWRDWQADKQQIETIEKEERRLGLREKVRAAIILGRLGGGALILGLDGDASQPLPSTIPAGALKFVHVVSRWRLSIGPLIRDPSNPWCGEPEYYQLSGNTQITIHPSRVIAFKGLPVPDMTHVSEQDAFWGDAVAQSVWTALQNADRAQNGFASLIEKARVGVVKIPDLMERWALEENEKLFLRRLELAQMGMSNHQMLAIDANEDWQQFQVNWANMDGIIKTYLAAFCGAAQIPATRLLGKAPDGMNATGDGDERNYNTMVAGKQENELRPNIDRVDAVMLPSLGISDPDVGYSFAPLTVLTEKEQADIAKTKSEAIGNYADRRLIPDQALAKGVQNMLVEDGLMPGLDGALAEIPEDERFSIGGDPVDENEGLTPEEIAAKEAATAGKGGTQA